MSLIDVQFSEYENRFRDALRKLRASTGLSSDDFSKRAGISHSYYVELESADNNTNPTLDVLIKIAGGLGMPLSAIFEIIESDGSGDAGSGQNNPAVTKKYTVFSKTQFTKAISEINAVMLEFRYFETDIQKVRIAAEEMYSNAAVHGNKSDSAKAVKVSAIITKEEVRIGFTDEGTGFCPADVPSPNDFDRIEKFLQANDTRELIRGHGIFMARYYMDSVKYNDQGNSVQITKLNSSLKNPENPFVCLQRMTVSSWAELAEYRDGETGEHLQRIPAIVGALAKSLSSHEEYKGYITPGNIHDLKIASVLHDIGKIGVSDTVLLKAGKLNEIEFDKIKQHVLIGGNFLKKAQAEWKKSFPELHSYFDIAVNVALYHHERWDGNGYVHGVKGNQIPFSARVVSIADVFDALVSDRCYRKAWSVPEAVEYIKKESGKMFDPVITEVFARTVPGMN